MNSKVCSGCGVEKVLSEYYRDAKSKDGHSYQCKACSHLRVKRYEQTERGKEIKRNRNLKYNQTEQGKEVMRKGYLKYKKTLEGKVARRRAQRKRESKMKDAGTFTNEEWNDRLLEYNYCCAYCYKPFSVDELTIDHMQPLSRGGTNTIDNIVPSCRSCNSRKGDKTPLEMLQKGWM